MKITATLDVLMRDLPKILAAGVEVAEVEVAEVEVSDKKPMGHISPGWFFSSPRFDDESYINPDELPLPISDRLQGGVPHGTRSYKFRTADEARKALSDAAIAWAKQQNQ